MKIKKLIFDLLLGSRAIHHRKQQRGNSRETFLIFQLYLSFATCYYKIKLFSPSPISKQKVNHSPGADSAGDEILLCISGGSPVSERSWKRRNGQPTSKQKQNTQRININKLRICWWCCRDTRVVLPSGVWAKYKLMGLIHQVEVANWDHK